MRLSGSHSSQSGPMYHYLLWNTLRNICVKIRAASGNFKVTYHFIKKKLNKYFQQIPRRCLKN
jgi:hypothetical protein